MRATQTGWQICVVTPRGSDTEASTRRLRRLCVVEAEHRSSHLRSPFALTSTSLPPPRCKMLGRERFHLVCGCPFVFGLGCRLEILRLREPAPDLGETAGTFLTPLEPDDTVVDRDGCRSWIWHPEPS